MHILLTIAAALGMASACSKPEYVIPRGSDSVPSDSSVVKVLKTSGQWTLSVNGSKFYVNGAATNRFYTDARKFGANTIRLYSPNKETVDAAYQAGLMVYLGLGMTAAQYMDYSDTAKVSAAKTKVLGYVKQYMGHPALLCWSIGNEMEASNEDNVNMWKAIGEVAGAIKSMDPNHPVTCALASASKTRVQNLLKYAPDIDFISVNSYYPNVGGIASGIASAGLDIPYMVTEFGPRGTWAMSPEPTRILPWSDGYSATSKALVEETSTEKEAVYLKIWNDDIKAKESAGCLGGFIFVWGYQTHGEVLNWYASYTTDKYTYGCCDAMQKCWTGSYPAVRAPRINSRSDLRMNGKVAEDAVEVGVGSSNSATVTAEADEGISVRYHWFIYKEGDHKTDGSMPDGIDGLIETDGAATVNFKAPSSAGAYRLYVFVLDDVNKKAASACIPFNVKAK